MQKYVLHTKDTFHSNVSLKKMILILCMIFYILIRETFAAAMSVSRPGLQRILEQSTHPVLPLLTPFYFPPIITPSPFAKVSQRNFVLADKIFLRMPRLHSFAPTTTPQTALSKYLTAPILGEFCRLLLARNNSGLRAPGELRMAPTYASCFSNWRQILTATEKGLPASPAWSHFLCLFPQLGNSRLTSGPHHIKGGSRPFCNRAGLGA